MGFDERRRTERRAEQHERHFRKGAFLMSTSRMHYGLGFALMGLAACGGNIDVGGNDPAGTAGAGGEQLATGGAGSGGSAGMNTGTHDAGVDQGTVCAEPSFETCPCTRRPGPTTSAIFCPVGSGTSVTMTIGEAGGQISLDGTPSANAPGFRLQIPAGALAGPTVITVTETTVPPPASYVDASPIYQIDPPNLMFAKPAALTLPFKMKNGSIPSTLAIDASTDAGYVRLADSYINAGFLQGSLSRTASVFAGYPKSGCELACP